MGQAIKIGICIPNEGHTLPEAYENRMLFSFHLGKLSKETDFEFYYGSVGRVLTPLARERLTEWSLDMGLDYMLQIDDDMIIPHDMFERLYKTMQEHNADVVAPLAFMRMRPYYPVLYRVIEGWDGILKKPYFQREYVKNYPKDTVVECDAVGFGSALIRLSMVKRMIQPFFMSTSSAGEDIWFCYNAKKEAKAKIVMDTSIKLGHLGIPPIVDEATFEEFNKNEEYRKQFGTTDAKLEPIGDKK